MTLAQLLSDIYDSLTIPEVRADAPPEDKSKEEDSDSSSNDSKDTPAEEPQEEEEEEPEDILPKLLEDCENSKQCAPFKHHYEECAERVQKWEEEEDDQKKGKKESCVEEYFHLMHCAGDCVAPKLWANLK